MQPTVPATPADVLDIPFGLRVALGGISRCARLLRFWDRPAPRAATDFAEMTLLDKMYWACKCRQPVLKAEKGLFAEEHFRRSRRQPIGLPPGFRPTRTLTLGAAGDLIMAEGVENSLDFLYAKVADLLFDQDISYANLESVITTQPLGKEVISDRESPTECCSPSQFSALKGHRGKTFSVLHTACNHSFDRGAEGVRTTLRQLAGAGILPLGTNGEPAEQRRGRLLTRNGITVGFAAATFGLNGRPVPPGEAYLVNRVGLLPRRGRADLSLLEAQIASCREQGADFVIASLHWGYEFEFFPRQRQVSIAHHLAELGADLILCHHPHVIQPLEYYRTRRDPQRVVPIAYSLGTLVWSFTAPHLVLSTILNLRLAQGEEQGRAATYVETVAATPVVRTYCAEGEMLRVQIERLDERLRAPAAAGLQDLQTMRRYVALVLGDD